jgi:ribosomal subunit interface protein
MAKLAKLDQKAMRIDVEVSKDTNSRQSDRRERVELTIRSRGPAIRAEAAADDRYTALDLAFAKLESRLRRVSDRRKVRHGDTATLRSGILAGSAAGAALEEAPLNDAAHDGHGLNGHRLNGDGNLDASAELDLLAGRAGPQDGPGADADGHVVPIQMEGDGPLVVREKEHPAKPMPIDQALLEMELVGHDFFLFHDSDCDRFSVVYRRRGYDYGVIRLVEE